MWTKLSNKSYTFYLSRDKNILFSFEDGILLCKSSEEFCSEIQ